MLFVKKSKKSRLKFEYGYLSKYFLFVGQTVVFYLEITKWKSFIKTTSGKSGESMFSWIISPTGDLTNVFVVVFLFCQGKCNISKSSNWRTSIQCAICRRILSIETWKLYFKKTIRWETQEYNVLLVWPQFRSVNQSNRIRDATWNSREIKHGKSKVLSSYRSSCFSLVGES